MDLDLRGRVVIVTGGGAGIGEAITRALLDEGAKVVAVGRMGENEQRFAAEMKVSGAACDFVEASLAEAEQCKRVVEFTRSTHGRLDGLVNNAGANDSVGLASGDPTRFFESLRQNLVHYYSMAHYALPMLREAKGAIVNISSKVALTGQGGTSAYAAAKGAQLALTREWAAELLPVGIRVNSVLPAEVLTPLYQRWLDTRADPVAALRHITERIPLGRRMTEGAEIAATTVFLLSAKQSGHTTAQHLVVDGGYTHLDRTL
ncbi:L-fucose dehydrogenase [Granulicella tundricola]|uniref:Short-chain dehydrogenase/reductase SDR n=1 Tax=Granulicella tundricola (strain ATCC BAA-1859 / DSM 23138 / MP5ACTX9) TaxID=1198114 RepID=E8X719_GRATM|nr:SDR family oxidoreductase [Granulicella tundricola]ADW71128.1 short-chain dehydrogenase/reductase SDR [Granulicella tundricola MP5ACTX9]